MVKTCTRSFRIRCNTVVYKVFLVLFRQMEKHKRKHKKMKRKKHRSQEQKAGVGPQLSVAEQTASQSVRGELLLSV